MRKASTSVKANKNSQKLFPFGNNGKKQGVVPNDLKTYNDALFRFASLLNRSQRVKKGMCSPKRNCICFFKRKSFLYVFAENRRSLKLLNFVNWHNTMKMLTHENSQRHARVGRKPLRN